MSFTIAMNHSACMERYKSKNTVLDCLKFDTIKLSDLRALYSENTPKYFLRSWLLQLNLFVNVSDENKLSEEQMIELAFLMYKEIYMLNLAELTLLFERIKSGFYFPFYNRIDATQILIACRSYRKERSVHLIEIEQRKILENDLKRVELEARAETRRIKSSILFRRKNRIITRKKNKTE